MTSMTRPTSIPLSFALAAVLSIAPVGAGGQASNQASGGGAVTAILVDVVVRDKAGNPIRDLKQEDFELVEDGQKQDVGSFTPIFRDAPAGTPGAPAASGTPAPAAAAARPATRVPSTVPGADAAAAAAATPSLVMAMVFDRLSSDNRPLAHRAALRYLSGEADTDRVISVYGIDLGLVPFQPFTRDMTKVRKAIDDMANRATSQFGSTRQQRQDLQDQMMRAGAAVSTATQGAGPGGGGAAIGGAAGDAQFAQMQQQSLATFDALERDQRGYSTANALMAVVSSMRNLPGRKAVMFFSEGLSIPTNAEDRFLGVIAAANRANVSIYSVDAAGLRAESTLKETREEVDAASRRMLSRNPTVDQTGEPMMAGLERNENNLRLDPQSGLGLISDQTGGMLVANSNDIRRGLGRVDSDLRNYYMLSYVPKNSDFDGKYRDISVKVLRSGATVLHRKGYFAVRAPAGAPVLGYEAPALALLDKTPVPNAFPVRAGALRFPEAARPGLTPIVVELPTAGLTFEPSIEDKTKYHADAIVLVRLKNDGGEVIDKMSQRYELQGAIEQIDRAKVGEVIFYRQPDLPPGVYQMETIVYDALSKKASVRYTTIEKTAVDPSKLRMSSLIVVRRGERIPPTEKSDNSPLYVGDTLVYPNLGTPLKRGADKELGFYFNVYLPEGTTGDATADLELLQNAKPLARVPLDLAKPDATHRIQQVSRIPIEQLTAGTYEIRVTVHHGAVNLSQATPFRIAD